MSRNTSNNSPNQSRQSQFKTESPTGDDANQSLQSETKIKSEKRHDATTASQPRNDTPLQTPAAPNKSATPETPSDRAILPLLLVSDRISQTEYLVYKHLHSESRNRAAITTNATITFSHAPPDAVWRVFHTAELLEMILLLLPIGYLYTTAQLTCHGFKTAMEASPTFQRSIAAATRGIRPSSNQSFAWGVRPKCMRFHYATAGRVVFQLTFTDLSFTRHLFKEHFRQMAVSDTLPLRIEVLWYEGDGVDNRLCECGRRAHLNQMVYMSSMSAVARRHKRITFGKVFDAVARRVPVGRRVGGMALVLTGDRHTFCGSEVGGADEGYLRAMST
jgi:hypothetical protein